jgi:hypothetical protein
MVAMGAFDMEARHASLERQPSGVDMPQGAFALRPSA